MVKMKHEMELRVGQEIPLTQMQRALLAESHVSGMARVNLEQIVIHFDTPGHDEATLRAALSALADRYEALRLVPTRNADGQLGQAICYPSRLGLSTTSMEASSEKARTEQLEAFLEQDRAQGFAREGALLWRAHRLLWSKGGETLVLTLHHAIVDGRAMARLTQELLAYLDTGALPPIAPAERSFADFCEALSSDVPNEAQAQDYFARYLDAVEDAGQLTLPNPPRAATKSTSKRQLKAQLPRQVSSDLRALSSQNDATLASVFQAAWGLLLARWQGRRDVVFGTVRSGRHAFSGCAQTVGCLINTLPMRVQITAQTQVSDLLQELRSHTRALHPLEQTPAELIRKASGLSGAQPLFETALMFENATLQGLVSDRPAGIQIELREEAGLPLMLSVYAEECIDVLFEYDPDRVSNQMANALFGQLQQLLAALAWATGDTPLGALDMLGGAERARFLDWAQPENPVTTTSGDLVGRFGDVVATNGARPALEIAGGQTVLTYGDLDAQSDARACDLREHGAGPGQIVAVQLGRSIEFVVTLLAILKTGAAFLPVDPAHPDAVRDHMLGDSGARIIVNETGIQQTANATTQPASVESSLRTDDDPEQLAYVIYTSGSTGKPKGVRVSRGNLMAHLDAMTAAFDMSAQDRVLQFAGLSFDVSVEEIFTTLMSGASLVLRSEEMAQAASAFLDAVEERALSVLNIPTAFWTVVTRFMSASGRELPSSVRLVIVGGERIAAQTLREWQSVAPGVRWLNGYGPTETTITCTLYEASDGFDASEVSIGRPTGHALAYVLAADGSLAPFGATGELAIGGPAVTLGYIGREADTARVFRPDPHNPGGRLYCTGDRAHWDEDGTLAFQGRQDRQIKLRGFRIDMSQVERAVETCLPGVEMVCDVLDANTPSARLTVWVATAEDDDLTKARHGLTNLLPSYMQPALVPVCAFPRTPNGKIDRAALPRPEAETQPTGVDAGPVTELEVQLGALMAQVLNISAVEPDQSFFDLGGHSLLSVEFIGRVEVATGKPLGIVDFTENPTPRALAKRLEQGEMGAKHIVPIQPNGSKSPLFGVHILGASESYFHRLSEYLGPDQPIMGVTVGSLDENTPTGIEFTASRYCADINEHYPDGPIHLMAVSLGAYMAFELARQLRDSGREVGLVALFDAEGPGGRDKVRGWRKLRAYLRKAKRNGWGYPAQFLHNRLYDLRNRLASLRMKKAKDDGEIQAPKTVLEFIATNEMAVAQYTAEPLDLPLVIFRSAFNDLDSETARREGLGWASVAAAGFELIDVPGGHLSMLQDPYVEEIANHMHRALAERMPAA